MLSGHTSLTLDAKGRLAIPSRYRAHLNEICAGKLSVTVHPDRCLMIYPWPEWEVVQRKVMKLSNMNRRARDLQRLIIGYAVEMELDASGRMQLTPSLREFADLDKNVVLIGVGNKFELWSEERWQSCQKDWVGQGENEGSLTEELQSLSL